VPSSGPGQDNSATDLPMYTDDGIFGHYFHCRSEKAKTCRL
jgi:hypothetical protein